MRRRLAIGLGLLLCWDGAARNSIRADDTAIDVSKLPPAADRKVDFAADIKPLFAARCTKCHGSTKHESGLRLNTKEDAFTGGDNGAAFAPGKSVESRLIRYVSGLDEDTVMPPEGEGERLSAEQVGLLRAWIDQGADWPESADDAGALHGSDHWAYKKPQRAALPPVKNAACPKSPRRSFCFGPARSRGPGPFCRS